MINVGDTVIVDNPEWLCIKDVPVQVIEVNDNEITVLNINNGHTLKQDKQFIKKV